MKKVIYIAHFPLNQKIAKEYFFDYLIKKQVTVEYWYLVNSVFTYDDAKGKYNEQHVVTIFNDKQLEEKIIKERDKDNSYLVLEWHGYKSHSLFRILTRNNCKLFFIEWGRIPMKKRNTISRVTSLILNVKDNYRLFLDKITVLFSKRFNLIKPFDVVFTAGESSCGANGLKRIPINFFDYSTYLDVNNISERIIKKPYCVFLDINLAFHKDLKWVGLNYIDPLKYHSALNKFFTQIETQYGVQVVVAAHPTASYDDKIFEGRMVLNGATARLIKDSEFVISHHSTSISYAVLNKKPLAFIYSDEIAKIYKNTIFNYIQDFAEYLGASMYNIDDTTRKVQAVINSVNQDKYNKYKYDFLTSKESENISSEEIFFKEITS